MLGLLLLVIVTVAITIWYLQRPIKPVVLTPEEKALVEAKLERMSGSADAGANRANTPGNRPDSATATSPAKSPANSPITRSTSPDRPASPGETLPPETRTIQPAEHDRVYVPGSKILRLTEREINGLLNANTDLGQTVRLELGRDAINAYVVAPIPADVPMVGGKIFRARGRFRVAFGDGVQPNAVLEDVTVFGLSLPKAWLPIKGENLLADAVGRQDGKSPLRGVKSIRVEPGALIMEVED
jgi:hypothetical protein